VLPIGTIVGARSGDKGGGCNIGLFTKEELSFLWLARYLTEDRFRDLFPAFSHLPIHRYRFDNLYALNFSVEGLLGEGVASSTRSDPQGKGLASMLGPELCQSQRICCDKLAHFNKYFPRGSSGHRANIPQRSNPNLQYLPFDGALAELAPERTTSSST
jgi:hypothetical protein